MKQKAWNVIKVPPKQGDKLFRDFGWEWVWVMFGTVPKTSIVRANFSLNYGQLSVGFDIHNHEMSYTAEELKSYILGELVNLHYKANVALITPKNQGADLRVFRAYDLNVMKVPEHIRARGLLFPDEWEA